MGDVAKRPVPPVVHGGCVIASLVLTVWVLHRIVRAVRPVNKKAPSTTAGGSTPLSPAPTDRRVPTRQVTTWLATGTAGLPIGSGRMARA